MSHSRCLPRKRNNRPRIELLEGRQLLATFSVTSAADSGPNTLRDAIVQANATSGADTITFDIAGDGVHTIAPTSPLPAITDPAVIDASTQHGYAGLPLIELNGSNILDSSAPPVPIANVSGLSLAAGASTIRGLAINRFTGFGLTATGDGNTIAANYIGTDATGAFSLRNQGGGISIASRNNTVGGITASDRNVISGNGGDGILLGGPGNQQLSNNRIIGNLIGLSPSGAIDLGNIGDGIRIASAGNQVVGGGLANIIAFNGGAGVHVTTQTGGEPYASNTISVNSIFSNTGKGIQVDNFDAARAPVLTSAMREPLGGGTRVAGVLNGAAPNAVYTIAVYSNPEADGAGVAEGRTFLGGFTVTTNAQGRAEFTSVLPDNVANGEFLTATATDPAGTTGEFSTALAVGTTAPADLAITGFASGFGGQTGQPLTYVFTVTNNGPSPSAGTVVTDTLPTGASLISATTTQGTVSSVVVNGTFAITLGSLASGQQVQITVTIQPTLTGTAVNVATVSDSLDVNATNNQSTIFTQIFATPPADLVILGASSPNPVAVGAELTYLFVVQNTSFQAGTTGVVVTDTLPPGLTFLRARSSQGTVTESSGTITANLGAIPAGANATVTIIVRPTAAGLIANAASVRNNEADPNSTNNDVVVNTTVNAAPPADLVVFTNAAPIPAQVGRDFTYAVVVANRGPAPASGVILRDILPEASTLVSVRPSQGSAAVAAGAVTADLGNLPAGAVAVVTIVVRPGAPGTLESRADVSADQPDFQVADNVTIFSVSAVGEATPPRAIDQKLIVGRKGIGAIVLTFSQSLDPVLAANATNYRIYDLGRDSKLRVEDGKPVAIASVTYDPTSRSVRLVPKSALAIGSFYRLVVNGPGAPGVVDLTGVVLDGDRNGLPDGIYSSLIGRGTHDRPKSLQIGAGRSNPKPHRAPRKTGVVKKPTSINIVVNN